MRAGKVRLMLRRDRHLIHNSPEAPAIARRFVGETLVDAPRAVVDVAALMVSELVTNCVRYAASDLTVSIEQTARQVRVDVTDADDDGEVVLQHPDEKEISGRGLYIVDRLSDEWGVDTTVDHHGKSVWFTLRL
jgi:anti-sigma regulatory factor (Ser/Thr protein kinase)